MIPSPWPFSRRLAALLFVVAALPLSSIRVIAANAAEKPAAGVADLPAGSAHHAATPAAPTAELFPLGDVRLLEGPFLHAQQLVVRSLLGHDVDRFMAPFRVEAGLEPKAAKYPNWESTGLDGHSAGHYLSALAQIAVVTGDPEIRRRLEYMVSEYAACQKAGGNGYVGAIPGSRELWAKVAAGEIKADNFSINGRWVPWYNLHKTFAGLRDAWEIAGNTQARDVLYGLTDWCATLVANLRDDQLQEMLRAEQGGMNEVLADVAAYTNDGQYLALARRFSHRALLEPLLRREDPLTGMHANTQIPKVIGFARIAELSHDIAWLGAARYFWQNVTERRNVAFGGNSVREHFNPPHDFNSMLESREGPETCNTYNLLRLTEQLFRGEPSAHYADYYERALFNHILSSQHPEHGGFVYFTPIRPRHYRVYSKAGHAFWCCVGSGMENHGKYGRFIYARDTRGLYVNLFLASELKWKEAGLVLRQETGFPDEAATRLTLQLERPRAFTLHVRHPAWVPAGQLAIRINGEVFTPSAPSQPSSYVPLRREWREGDRVELALPMHTTVERLPDRSDYVALLHGPILLAARTGTERLDGLIADDSRMGHIAPGPYEPLDRAPMLVGEFKEIASHVKPVAGKPLTFTARELIQPAEFRILELVPFHRIHDARTMLYWRTVDATSYPGLVRELEAKERERLALESRTLDRVTPGEQQPEVDHNLRSEDSSTGSHLGRAWRDAGKWFSYELRATPRAVASGAVAGVATDPAAPAKLELQLTYFGAERRREFDLVVNDVVIAQVKLDGRDPDRFVDTTYPIPAEVAASAAKTKGLLTVKFVAAPKSRAGAIYDLRLLQVKE